MKTANKITDKMIREWYGHNGVECRVVIKRDGQIMRYGSPDCFDRSKDYWSHVGYRDETIREMTEG